MDAALESYQECELQDIILNCCGTEETRLWIAKGGAAVILYERTQPLSLCKNTDFRTWPSFLVNRRELQDATPKHRMQSALKILLDL